MPDQIVPIPSDHLQLAGVVRIPDGVGPNERRPAVIVLHGFGSNMQSGNVQRPVAMLDARGYVEGETDRIDRPLAEARADLADGARQCRLPALRRRGRGRWKLIAGEKRLDFRHRRIGR